MLPNGANQSYNPYSPAYPTYLPQQSMYNQNAPVQLLKAVKNQGHYNSSRKPYNKQSAPKQEGENNA